ncbi:RsmB/NOP family class I SAM-dependent RNA methyltransferase [Pseudooceanicola sp. CBS1P-1]|uniref:Methyltransferase domain-containing protein n=1 Tax=Pseudooceanicola albus TaxID=2692189 RepID=A0A6L7G752_9RHOB|nr:MULTISPECIES: RsmB/NOP family class I SAM-dependent RNA methyltransferase [Pseudooceanicola]MBT9386166.1 RsmB/NOP family class I SAM-dependent RNA methyltransferase [Pseudooceanicola endophyticus]MXN19417.1 methyltransferase domain-containing protein [Pseudooceanicola albus]
MTSANRLQAALDLMGDLDRVARPADAVVSAWFRARRKMDDRDRGALLERLNAILRHRARLGWWLERHGRPDTPRNRLLAWLSLGEGQPPEQIRRQFSGAKFAPAPLTAQEDTLLTKLRGSTMVHPAMSQEVRLECPDWAAEPLHRRFGDSFEAEMAALLTPPTLDLRVNTLKADRAEVLRALEAQDLQPEPSGLAPQGIRLRTRLSLARLEPLKSGAVEIQDEGSQLVAMLVEAGPGDRVVDFCAGAGGKTLAIAAQMENKGRIIACDVNEGRLKRASERFRKAGVHNAETRLLTSETDRWVKRHKGSFDRVLVDAPCSGTGTWRRNPDARWRAPEEQGLDSLIALQARILSSAARLVKPGGRLVYATCSLLPEENEAQVDAFLAAHPDFRILPLSEAAPGIASAHPVHLSLTPARHDTDGFFAAILLREAADPAQA